MNSKNSSLHFIVPLWSHWTQNDAPGLFGTTSFVMSSSMSMLFSCSCAFFSFSWAARRRIFLQLNQIHGVDVFLLVRLCVKPFDGLTLIEHFLLFDLRVLAHELDPLRMRGCLFLELVRLPVVRRRLRNADVVCRVIADS